MKVTLTDNSESGWRERLIEIFQDEHVGQVTITLLTGKTIEIGNEEYGVPEYGVPIDVMIVKDYIEVDVSGRGAARPIYELIHFEQIASVRCFVGSASRQEDEQN